MAIYSLSHSSIGRSTHAPGTAGAHISYITRRGAQAEVLAERMPDNPTQARNWVDQAEASERKNGRVLDKIMVALPRELNHKEQAALIRKFGEDMTQGRASWLAAIHRDDAGNPHAHVIIRDKDTETGKRVAGLSEKGSTARLRLAWEQAANSALRGKGVQIDRRSLKDQGIDQPAQIHVGPKALAMEERGVRPQSQFRKDHRGRVINYPEIDQSVIHGQQTRAERNARIITQIEFQGEMRLKKIEGEKRAAAMVQKAQTLAEDSKAWGIRIAAQKKAALALAAQKKGAADRYADLVQKAQTAAKAADPATWQKTLWAAEHPMRARLHRLGLKARPLVEIEGRIANAAKTRLAMEADLEGKHAYEAIWTDRRPSQKSVAVKKSGEIRHPDKTLNKLNDLIKRGREGRELKPRQRKTKTRDHGQDRDGGMEL